MPLPSHCRHCGGLATPVGRSAARCTSCGEVLYAHSRPAAGVFIERDGEVLLVRRGAEPAIGRWDVPGGFLEEGEDPESGARREIREELSLELGELRLVLVDVNTEGDGAVLDVLFEASARRDEPRPASDVLEARWWAVDDLPADLAFESTRRILDRWIGQRRARSRRP